jgi:hypothetical protein
MVCIFSMEWTEKGTGHFSIDNEHQSDENFIEFLSYQKYLQTLYI